MKILALILCLALSACATVTLTAACPASSTGVSFGLAGSTVGNQTLSMVGSAVSTGKLLAGAKEGNRASSPPAATSATMTYSYLPIFGSDSGSLACVQPPQQVIVVTSPPASVVQ